MTDPASRIVYPGSMEFDCGQGSTPPAESALSNCDKASFAGTTYIRNYRIIRVY
jgi:hypothetical protein